MAAALGEREGRDVEAFVLAVPGRLNRGPLSQRSNPRWRFIRTLTVVHCGRHPSSIAGRERVGSRPILCPRVN